ncbi:MAG: hypothetical protein HYS25_03980 [Ignavibacteriales bacterium]|nr:hypothetical protein [Ignavibacteriales bacterium]
MFAKLDPEKIIEQVSQLAGNKLYCKDDLQRIIEHALAAGKLKILEELAFQAKFSQGLIKIIQKKETEFKDEYFAAVQKEFSENIQKIHSLIRDLLSSASEFIKNIYEEKYFQLTHQSLNNLNDLCNDLGFLKIYLNDLKRSGG